MSAELEQLLSNLNTALNLEYTLIVHYPRLAGMVRDAETREMINELSSVSIKHADIVAEAITRLGGKPNWSFEAFPSQVNLVDVFQKQLKKEETARDLHRQSAHLVSVGDFKDKLELRNKFEKIASEEESHIKIVENILERLTKPPA